MTDQTAATKTKRAPAARPKSPAKSAAKSPVKPSAKPSAKSPGTSPATPKPKAQPEAASQPTARPSPPPQAAAPEAGFLHELGPLLLSPENREAIERLSMNLARAALTAQGA